MAGWSVSSLLRLAAIDVHARSLGEHEHAEEDDQSPGKLNGDGDTVAASVVTALGRIIDNGGKQKTDSDGKLVGTNDGTANPLGCGLGLVERNQSRYHADAVSSEESPCNEDRYIGCHSL
jgi:hypothetical protein